MHARHHSRRGLTLIEILVASSIMVTGLLGLLSAIVSASALQRNTRESLLASNAVQATVEELRALPMQELYTSYGAGSFGETFDVPGLSAVPGDPVGQVGRVELFFDETIQEPRLGLPADLNADGDTLDADLTNGRIVTLPARVTVRWQGVSGARQVSYQTLLLRH